MSTGGDPLPNRTLIVAVACLSMAAAAVLINVAGSMFGFSRVLSQSPLGLATAIGIYGPDLFLVMPVAGVLGGALGLVVIHRVPRHGWIWLLLAGTLLPVVLTLPTLTEKVVLATAGAGSALLIMGLLGAANWLMHAAPTGAGAAVAGVALAAPLLGGLLVFFVRRELIPVDSLVAVNRTLRYVSIAAAVGLAALLPMLLRLPSPPPPTLRITTVGLIAAALPLVPNIVLRIGWDVLPPAPTANPFEVTVDRWAVLVGVCGLAILATAVTLAARVGATALCAALATGLVLYGVDLPLSQIRPPINSPAATAAGTAVGLALGIAAAVSRWRAWGAGMACAVTGIATLLLLVNSRPSALVAGALLSVCVFAAVTTYAWAAATLAERAQAPALLGAVAAAIQVGLLLSGALVPHGALAASPFSPQPLIVAAGVALLVAALIVVALPRIRTPVDQAELSPGAVR